MLLDTFDHTSFQVFLLQILESVLAVLQANKRAQSAFSDLLLVLFSPLPQFRFHELVKLFF